MSFPRRGSLYWARLDKRRPALVLSSDIFNRNSSYLTVVPGSTRLRPLVTHVELRKGEGGVSRPTMLLCEHIQEIHRTDLEPAALGRPLTAARLLAVERAILFYLDLGPAPEA